MPIAFPCHHYQRQWKPERIHWVRLGIQLFKRCNSLLSFLDHFENLLEIHPIWHGRTSQCWMGGHPNAEFPLWIDWSQNGKVKSQLIQQTPLVANLWCNRNIEFSLSMKIQKLHLASINCSNSPDTIELQKVKNWKQKLHRNTSNCQSNNLLMSSSKSWREIIFLILQELCVFWFTRCIMFQKLWGYRKQYLLSVYSPTYIFSWT